MKFKLLLYSVLFTTWTLSFIEECNASFTFGIPVMGALGAAFYAGFDKLKCSFYECCSSNSIWTKPNMTGK